MQISSISTALRHRATPSLPLFTAVLRRVPAFRFLSTTTAGQHQSPTSAARNPQQPKPNKHLLKSRDIKRHLSGPTPIFTPEESSPRTLSPNHAIGMVASAQANFMRVVVSEKPAASDGGEGPGVELLCVVRALLKKIKRRVLVGDRVLVGSIDWVERRGMIENVYARTSETVDPPVANVDRLVVLFSMDQPRVEAASLTRFLVDAESSGIPLTLALNKAELVSEETLVAWKSKLRSWGYGPIFCSVQSKRGLDTLQFTLREKTSVIVGPSGVGKSSLINALRSSKPVAGAAEGDNCVDPILGSKWLEDQRVGEVSVRSGRGKHTTRHVSLLPLSGGGYLADTPGFNQPSLMKVTKQSLAQHFPELREMLNSRKPEKCFFNNCLHIGEKDCIVKADWERYPYYLELLDEIKTREEFQLRTVGTKREDDVRYKVGDMGVKHAEPRLELKKHRRQSRKKINQSFLGELDELDDDDNLLDEEDPILRAVRHENQ